MAPEQCVLESFLARLAVSLFVDQLVLKGGVAPGRLRRATADSRRRPPGSDPRQRRRERPNGDLRIRGATLDDGVEFDVHGATAEVIRGKDATEVPGRALTASMVARSRSKEAASR